MRKVNNTSLIEIKELAEYIALSFDNSVTPLEKIIKGEKVSLIYDDYGSNSFDGMSVYDEQGFYIHLNVRNGNKPNSTRGRFTLAHELGHYFIDSHRIGLKSGLLSPHPTIINESSYNRIEREADYFASCLLMPENRFQKEIFKRKFSIDLIQKLAKKFLVSFTAAAIRFSQLGNHPIMIVYAENGLIKWKITSDDFPYKWILLDDNRIPSDTVLGEYFELNNTDDIKKEEEVYAVDWFNYVKKYDVDRVFYEYCLPYKSKAISVIWEE